MEAVGEVIAMGPGLTGGEVGDIVAYAGNGNGFCHTSGSVSTSSLLQGRHHVHLGAFALPSSIIMVLDLVEKGKRN
ncbi:hypothetical protein Patl1_23769 [Pistacia atlantica]|uniref:Uncharacterized protein n=1 Tax=Pistacia atlantica TaxID=434234 RepID=A0ACC1A0X5_9ROSI|nr:hypothetical protein Patl1_23769 [Pistacia atlantica]